LRVHNPTNSLPVPVSCDFTSRSAKLKKSLLDNDDMSASDSTRLEASCSMTVDTLQTGLEILPVASSCDNANSLQDENAGAWNTSETARCVRSHVLPDCETTQVLNDSVKALVTVPANSVTESESGMDTDFHKSLSLNANNASSLIEDSSGAVKLGLCISVDSALKGFTPTVVSPSEDFQSIYALNNSSTTSSAVTGGTSVIDPQTIHSFPDTDSIDAWLEYSLPGKFAAQSLCVSRRTAWCVDKANHLYYSSLKGPGLSWINADQPTQQISSSPSGFIVWRVYRGSAYSAIGRITGKSPAGTEWREVAREVAYVAADDNVVW